MMDFRRRYARAFLAVCDGARFRLTASGGRGECPTSSKSGGGKVREGICQGDMSGGKCPGECPTHPAAGSTCGSGILYEWRVADHHRARVDGNMQHCSPWLDDDNAILAHSQYADVNHAAL